MCDAEVTPFTADRGCSAPFPGCAAPSDVSSAGDVAQTLVTQLLNASGVRTVWASMGTGSALHQARAAHEFFYISSLSRSSPPVERGLLRARACACMRARRPAFTGTARRCGTSCSKGQRTCLCPMLRVGLLPALHSMLCSVRCPPLVTRAALARGAQNPDQSANPARRLAGAALCRLLRQVGLHRAASGCALRLGIARSVFGLPRHPGRGRSCPLPLPRGPSSPPPLPQRPGLTCGRERPTRSRCWSSLQTAPRRSLWSKPSQQRSSRPAAGRGPRPCAQRPRPFAAAAPAFTQRPPARGADGGQPGAVSPRESFLAGRAARCARERRDNRGRRLSHLRRPCAASAAAALPSFAGQRAADTASGARLASACPGRRVFAGSARRGGGPHGGGRLHVHLTLSMFCL